MLTGVAFALTALWTGWVGSVIEFNIARFLSGMAVGAASVVSPAYIAEISPAPLRGRLTSLNQMGVVSASSWRCCRRCGGRLAGSISAPFWLGLEAWRWMFLTEIVPALAADAGRAVDSRVAAPSGGHGARCAKRWR